MDKRGMIFGIIAYTMWGFFPLYWRALNEVSAGEILVHRIIWSLVFLAILLILRRHWSWWRAVQNRGQTFALLFISASLLGLNWFIYIWAVNSNFVVETSLGYFINPLVNVFLGTLFLRELLRPGQWLAVGIAAVGVAYLTWSYGAPPWIALSLAFSFGIYGLMKKKIKFGSTEGLFLEMSYLFLPGLAYLLYLEFTGRAAFGASGPLTHLLLLGSGAVTAIPLLFFGAAARRIPLSTMGLLQYIAPTFQFLIGIYIFKEPFTTELLVGFSIIWTALAVYSLEGIWQRRIENQPTLIEL